MSNLENNNFGDQLRNQKLIDIVMAKKKEYRAKRELADARDDPEGFAAASQVEEEMNDVMNQLNKNLDTGDLDE